MLITEFANTLDELRVCRVDAALALNRLHQDGTGLVAEQCLHALKIVEICELDVRDQRFERVLIVVVSSHGQSAETASVK